MKAFTFIETIVVLILFAITFVLCSYFMENVWKLFNRNKALIETDVEYNLFYDDFSRNFKKSHLVYWDPAKNEIKCSRLNSQTSYIFKMNYILRSSNQKVDTFHIIGRNVRPSLNDKLIIQASPIDFFSFRFFWNNDSMNVSIFKEYDSLTKLEIEEGSYGFD